MRFELTHLSIVVLKTTALDHSANLALFLQGILMTNIMTHFEKLSGHLLGAASRATLGL